MIDIERIVRAFRKAGFSCRKKRKAGYYTCSYGSVDVEISYGDIEVKNLGEFRSDYLRAYTSDKYSDEDVMEMLKRETGAKDAWIDVGYDAYLILKFDPEKYERAIEVAKRIGEKDLWIAITNTEGELRLFRGKEVITRTEEWLKEFVRD